jgi:hypothetical protein
LSEKRGSVVAIVQAFRDMRFVAQTARRLGHGVIQRNFNALGQRSCLCLAFVRAQVTNRIYKCSLTRGIVLNGLTCLNDFFTIWSITSSKRPRRHFLVRPALRLFFYVRSTV